MEEIKKLLEDCECKGYRCPHEISGKHYVMISEDVDDLIDLAVSKERERINQYINENNRRNPNPLWAWVDATDLARFINTK